MPVPGPSHDKGKQCAEPACDLMQDLNDSDPNTNNDSDSDEDRVKKGTKLQDPDTFDRSNPEKLSSFLFQCVLTFKSKLRTFKRNRTKIYYALSFLRGTTLENFEPAELQEHFGPVDTEEDAEEDLEDLKMGTNHHATKYFISFAKYKARTQFNIRGYYCMVKNMLPDCILDDLAKIYPKPRTYESLRQVVLQIDQCYWQSHLEESRCKAHWGLTTSNTSNSNNNANSSNNSGSKSNKSQAPNNSKSKTTTVTVTNTIVPQNTHLGPDGWLMDAKCKHRIDTGLCIVCGLKGHIAKDCNKARWNNNQASGSGSNNHPAPKACASNTEEKPNTDDKAKAKDSASGSKN
ncbi:hypothetical protein M422DRAFT_271628 [Sphaerobolus stellatus SS14]|uniref:CCHC-type domain-containing protein n=1 Tax=Sphaerobolus stellatus (strain SS14) TaxID=990650 RepID=A0A0C9TDE2_SPHS4|nr:hypothetical protein M422DRAFT_271628 [Sphaerobolus stellatus SS14]